MNNIKEYITIQRQKNKKGGKKDNKTINESIRTCTPKVIICGIVILIIVFLVFYYIFLKNNNKFWKNGNNLNDKFLKEIEEYILNINSYEADITVEISSNKNKTKYVIKQQYNAPNIEKQIIKEPNHIKGIETIYDGYNLIIKNSKFNISKIYENYNYITKNYLWLNSFIEDYKSGIKTGNSKIYEKDNKVIMEVKTNEINYNSLYKKIIFDKTIGKIEKLIVQDRQQKSLIYILYNEIKIN